MSVSCQLQSWSKTIKGRHGTWQSIRNKQHKTKKHQEANTENNKKMMLQDSARELSVLILLALLSGGLQAPAILHMNETAEGEELSSCPGYYRGNPGHRNMSGCETGMSLGPVDHMMAFRFNSTHNPDWSSCGLPELPQAK